MHMQIYFVCVWLLYSVSCTHIQEDKGQSPPGGIAEELNAEAHILLKKLKSENHPLRDLLCSYVNDELLKLSQHGRMHVEGLTKDLSTRPPTDAKLFGRVSSDAKVSIRDFFPKSTSGGSSLVNVPLSTVTYHCDTMKLTLHTPSLGSYSIIPGVMELTNFALTFELTGDSSISIIFTGEWKLSKTTIHSSLHYLTKTKRFVFSGSPTGSAPSFKSLIEGLVHQSIPIPGDQDTFQDIKILGETDGHSSGIITLSASVGKAGRVYLILEQNPDVTPSRRHAFAVDIEKVRFSKIIQKLTGQDVSSFPFFGSLVIPEVGYTISTKEISSDIIKHLFKASHLLSYNKGVIPEGKVIYVLLGPEIANEPFRMISNNDQIRFEGDNGTHINVAKFIHLIPKANLNLLQLPPGVDNVGQPSITDFILYPLQKRIVVRADLQHTLKYFQNVLSIRNPHIELDVTVPSGALSFEATGDIKLGSTDLSVSIAKDAQHRYIFKARTTNLPLSSILSSFSAKLLPPPLEPISKSLALINFVIKDPRMAMLMESSTSQQIFLTGQPVIAGLSVKRMLATIVRVGGANKIAIGIELEKSNLADILGKISTGASKVIHAIPLLNQARDTVIVVSPEDFNNVALSLDEKHHFDLKRGITVRTNLPFPADESCTRDPFCAVARSLLPHGTVLHIDANIVNVANFRFIASLTGEIAIPGGLKIKKAGVELRVGEDTSIGIIGQIALRNPKLEFTTRIYYSVSGVVLQMIMAGCWRDAFGLGVMDICNVHGSVGIAPGTVISELSLGSEIHFKCLKQKQQQQLTAIGYVGLNTVEPRNNYYYANFPKGLTLASLLGVLCIKVDGVPSPIANTKLQPGFKSSFTVAPLGKSIPEIKLHIPPGLQMNGTVHSLGMEASCNISTTPSERMYVSIALPPLKVGKLLRMFLSRIVQTKGPYLRVDIRPPTVTAEASGYLSVLGITVEATLIFTKQQMSATIQGKILGIVDASLTVYSAHGVSFSSSNFQVRGSFKSKIFSTIENIIKNTAAKAADVAKAALNRAQNYLTSKSSAYRQASNKLSYARRKVTQALNKFKNAERTVNRWKSRVNSACRERSCGSVCVPGCGRCKCGWKGCRCRCSKCYKRVPDYACRTKNEVCKRLKKPILKSLDGARYAFRLAQQGWNRAKQASSTAGRYFNTAKQRFNNAKNALGKVNRDYSLGLQLDRFGPSRLIDVRKINFHSALSSAAGGRFSLSITAVILGKTRNVKLNANIRNVCGTIARPLGERVIRGFGKLAMRC